MTMLHLLHNSMLRMTCCRFAMETFLASPEKAM